jgi:hypothetical protein
MPLFRRFDGDLARDVPATRRIMPFLMRTRTESAVYFEQRVDAEPGLRRLARLHAEAGTHATFFHLVIHALVETLAERPRLNRFVSGQHIYQRRGIWISYSAKKALSDEAPIFVVKRELTPGRTLGETVQVTQSDVREGRSDRPSHVDKELGVLLRLPTFLLGALVRLLRWLDARNLAPRALIGPNPMFASVFIANLGSVRLEAAFHHLYEYGNIPIFVTVGRVHDAVVPLPDGRVAVRKQVLLRWSFDERIEDGLYCAHALERLRARLESEDGAAP